MALVYVVIFITKKQTPIDRFIKPLTKVREEN